MEEKDCIEKDTINEVKKRFEALPMEVLIAGPLIAAKESFQQLSNTCIDYVISKEFTEKGRTTEADGRKDNTAKADSKEKE